MVYRVLSLFAFLIKFVLTEITMATTIKNQIKPGYKQVEPLRNTLKNYSIDGNRFENDVLCTTVTVHIDAYTRAPYMQCSLVPNHLCIWMTYYSRAMAIEPKFQLMQFIPQSAVDCMAPKLKHTRIHIHYIMKNNMFSVITNEFNCIMFKQLNEQVQKSVTYIRKGNSLCKS